MLSAQSCAAVSCMTWTRTGFHPGSAHGVQHRRLVDNMSPSRSGYRGEFSDHLAKDFRDFGMQGQRWYPAGASVLRAYTQHLRQRLHGLRWFRRGWCS